MPIAPLPMVIDYPAARALRQLAALHDELPKYLLDPLKQRTEKAARTVGRTLGGIVIHRLVPLSEPQYVSQLTMMVATLKIPLEQKNKRSGRMEKYGCERSPTGQCGPG